VSESTFSSRILRRFVESVAVELGRDQYTAVLALSRLPAEWGQPETFLKMGPNEAAEAYAALQAAMRSYYGRGARGGLLRVGQRLWNLLLDDAALVSRTQAAVVKRLPVALRRKSVLELLARLIGAQAGDITLHTLDLDLLLVDHASPGAQGQRASNPICFVTQGLIRESLLWATKQGFTVEETACRATGQPACEFQISSGKVM
jgi:predicted hydrocarbon binding protein